MVIQIMQMNSNTVNIKGGN